MNTNFLAEEEDFIGNEKPHFPQSLTDSGHNDVVEGSESDSLLSSLLLCDPLAAEARHLNIISGFCVTPFFIPVFLRLFVVFFICAYITSSSCISLQLSFSMVLECSVAGPNAGILLLTDDCQRFIRVCSSY